MNQLLIEIWYKYNYRYNLNPHTVYKINLRVLAAAYSFEKYKHYFAEQYRLKFSNFYRNFFKIIITNYA